MKRGWLVLLIVTVVFGFSGAANAYFGKIGTARYDSNSDGTYESYNLLGMWRHKADEKNNG